MASTENLHLSALLSAMKTHVGDYEFSHSFRPPVARRSRRKTVSAILRAAYRKHLHDRETALALRHCLR